MIKVYMGVPSNGTVVDSQQYILRHLEKKYKDKVELVYPTACVHRIFHDAAREAIVQEFLATDCDILWFLDSDITPAENVLDLITEHGDKWMAAGAPYPIFMGRDSNEPRKVLFTCYEEHPTGGLKLVPVIPYEGTAFCAGLATGCLFLKREVFDLLERPYFEFKYDPITRAPIVGEDLGFCLKLKELGIPFFTDFSMVCKHQKTIDLVEVNNYAIEFGNAMVEAYAVQAKIAASDAVRYAFEKGVEKGRKETAPPKKESGLILMR